MITLSETCANTESGDKSDENSTMPPLISEEEMYSMSSGDESENDGSDSGSSVTCYFPFRFDCSFGHVIGLGSGIFVPTVVESKRDIFVFVMFVPIVVKSKDS